MSRKSFIVQAPAGSGKTELLIQRYLKLLETVETPDAVVAITFTRKAAGEMRSRVLQALRAAQPVSRQTPEHERVTFQIARDVLEHERRLGWNLLQNPARLRIETIDALVRGHHPPHALAGALRSDAGDFGEGRTTCIARPRETR